jgi:hypothetical protein
VQADDETFRCDGCDVVYHDDCADELGGCSTLGCARQGEGPPRSEADEILAALRARPLVEPEDATAPAPRADLRLPPATPEERAREARDRALSRAWQHHGTGERARWRGSFYFWTGLCALAAVALVHVGHREGTPLSTEELLVLLGIYLLLAVPMLISWRLAR